MSLRPSYFMKNHFFPPSTEEEKRELFKKSVSNVIIEISSFCNRRCHYCPVSQVDRSSSNNFLAEDIFEGIIQDLALIDYSDGICLNLYNEPTADRELLLERLRSVRQQLPDSRIYFSTNGDYLNQEYIKEMADAGLSELYVTIHTPRGKQYNDAFVVSRFCELSVRLAKAIKVTTVSHNHTVQGVVSLFGIPINVFSTNYDIFGYDRAGAISSLTAIAKARTAPCNRVFHDFTVSYDGTVFPCCQMFADNENHKKNYAIGNIKDFPNVFEAYASGAMAGWRSSLLRFGPKASPCDTCPEDNLPGSKEEWRERDSVYKQHVDSTLDKSAFPGTKRISRLLKGLGK